jgi:hypothetical protein
MMMFSGNKKGNDDVRKIRMKLRALGWSARWVSRTFTQDTLHTRE